MARIKRRCICPVCDTERPATIGKDGRLTIDGHRPSFKKSEEVWPINSRGECRGSGIDVAEGELGSLFYAIIHEIFGNLYETFPSVTTTCFFNPALASAYSPHFAIRRSAGSILLKSKMTG